MAIGVGARDDAEVGNEGGVYTTGLDGGGGLNGGEGSGGEEEDGGDRARAADLKNRFHVLNYRNLVAVRVRASHQRNSDYNSHT